MIVHRSHPESAFTIIPDATLRDPRLSYRARGVLAEILSRPDDWTASADALWRRARSERGELGEGRNALRAAFAELAATGYLHRVRRQAGRGRFTTELHVFDSPDGLEAWLAAEAFRAQVVDSSPSAGVSAGRTDDGTGRRRSHLGKQGVSADRTDDGTGRRRSHLGKQGVSADRTDDGFTGVGPPGVGPPGVGPPGVGPPGVITETYDEDLDQDLNTKTYDEDNHSKVLTEPGEVEGNGARPGQDHSDACAWPSSASASPASSRNERHDRRGASGQRQAGRE